MFCQNCGNKYEGNETFCIKCGTPRNNVQIPINNRKEMSSKKSIIIGICILILGFAIGLATFFFFGPFLGIGFLFVGSYYLSKGMLKDKKDINITFVTIVLSFILIVLLSVIGFCIWSGWSAY